MAKFTTRFKAFGRMFKFTLDTKDLSRNYDDENYAYWIRCNHGHVFEINIWKSPDKKACSGWSFTDKGLANCYATHGDFEDDKLTEEHRITLHMA